MHSAFTARWGKPECCFPLLLLRYLWGITTRMAAFLTVISYGISAVLLFGLREVKSQSGVKSRIRETFGMLGSLLKNRRMLFLLIAAAMIGETSHTITVFLNQPQYVRSAMSSEAIAVVFVVMTVAGIVSSALSDKITAKAGIKRLGIGIFGISALACACLAATKSAFLSAACIILLEITCGVFQPLQTEIQNREIKTDERATALSMNAVFMDGAAIFINLLFGKITDIGLPAAMILGCFFYILSGAMFALSRRCGKQTE